jgi:hypothetical protein
MPDWHIRQVERSAYPLRESVLLYALVRKTTQFPVKVLRLGISSHFAVETRPGGLQ